MTLDWTNPKTWTFRNGEHIAFADAALNYCHNCATKYPEAENSLKTLRDRASQLRAMSKLEKIQLKVLLSELQKDQPQEGSGFDLLVQYVSALLSATESE